MLAVAAQRAVLGQRPARLAHEPHRHLLDGLRTGRPAGRASRRAARHDPIRGRCRSRSLCRPAPNSFGAPGQVSTKKYSRDEVTAIGAPLPAAGPTQAKRPQLLAVGVMIWLGSEFMFFSGLFAAFFTIRATCCRTGLPPGRKLDTIQALIFTFVLLASSPTMQFGVWAQERGERGKARALDRDELPARRSVPRQPDVRVEDAAVPAAYQRLRLALLHHVRAARSPRPPRPRGHDRSARHGWQGPRGDAGETPVFQAVSYYWHFVDIVWIGLFSALFLLS